MAASLRVGFPGRSGSVGLLLLLAALTALAAQSSARPADQWRLERRAAYWPGMWQYDRYGDTSHYSDADDREAGASGAAMKRGYYWPGMWRYDRDRKQYLDKRGYYWPGMWQFERSPAAMVDKRAYFWPGMWRYQQRTPMLRKRASYDFYWLGKACGETGDPDACRILDGLYY